MRRLKIAFLAQIPASALLYLLALGQYGVEGPFLGVLKEPLTLGFYLVAVLWATGEVLLLLPLVGEPPLFGEFSGLSYDPKRKLIMGLVLLPDVVSCLDRGHFRAVPIDDTRLRAVGLLLLFLAMLLTFAADRRLARHFKRPGTLAERALITEGAYRFIRHPRSAGLFLGKIATPLALGSALGLLAVVPAVVLLPRFMAREEEHMLRTYGDAYRFYRTRTKRLIPWVY